MYKVIKFFTDLKDHDHVYRVGDEFPRKGLTVSEERFKELSTDQNKRGIPLIEAVAEDKPKAEPQAEIELQAEPELISENEPEAETEPEKAEPEEKVAKKAEAPKRGRKSKK